MTVGARIGVPLDGVGMPSHFLLRDRVDPTVFVDAFDNGAVLDAVGCEGLWRSITASDRAFDPAWLEPVGPEEILARMLANLSSIYRAHGDHGALVWVHELRAAIPGIGPTELIELGAALVGAGQLGRAAAAFDLAAGRLDGELAARCRRSAAHLRARLN